MKNGHVTEVVSFMYGEWSCCRIASLMEGAWSCYGDGQFNGARMAMLLTWSVLLKGDWSCYGEGQFNGRSMVILPRLSIFWRENGHVTDVASVRMGENGHVTEVTLVEIEGSCYRGGMFNGGIMVMLQRWPV